MRITTRDNGKVQSHDKEESKLNSTTTANSGKEHYFSLWSLGNSLKQLKTNQVLVSTVFFTIMIISFFQSAF